MRLSLTLALCTLLSSTALSQEEDATALEPGVSYAGVMGAELGEVQEFTIEISSRCVALA